MCTVSKNGHARREARTIDHTKGRFGNRSHEAYAHARSREGRRTRTIRSSEGSTMISMVTALYSIEVIQHEIRAGVCLLLKATAPSICAYQCSIIKIFIAHRYFSPPGHSAVSSIDAGIFNSPIQCDLPVHGLHQHTP